MSDKTTGADLLAALAAERGLQTKSAAETLQELTAEQVEALSKEELDALLQAAATELDEATGREKTASEVIAEMTPEELAAELGTLSEEEQTALLARVEAEEAEQAKTAALMSGKFDDQALAGQVWGTAAGEAFANTLAKVAEEDEWEQIDPSQMTAEEFLAGVQSGEIVPVDGSQPQEPEKVAAGEGDEIDLSQVSAEDLMAGLQSGELVLDEGTGVVKVAGVRAAVGAGAARLRAAMAGKGKAAMKYTGITRASRGARNVWEGVKHPTSGQHLRIAAKGLGQMATTPAAAGLVVVPSAVYARRRKNRQ